MAIKIMETNDQLKRSLKMKFKMAQNIDTSYAVTNNNNDKDEIIMTGLNNYDDEDPNDTDGNTDEANETTSEDQPIETVEEDIPPPDAQIEDEMTTEEVIIDEQIGGESELDIISSSVNGSNTESKFEYVQSMPSSSETWSERVSSLGNDSKSEGDTELSLSLQQLPPLGQSYEHELEEEVVGTASNEEQGDDIEGDVMEATTPMEDSEEGKENDEQDDEKVEEEINSEVDVIEDDVVEEGDSGEEVNEEDEENEQQEGEEEKEEDEENDEQQEEVTELETTKPDASQSNSPDDALELDPCKNNKWHPDFSKDFKQCSNEVDIAQAQIQDETFQKMYFFDTLADCCQKFFHVDECEGVDVCADLEVGKAEEVAFERQADGELEEQAPDEGEEPGEVLPGDEGYSESNADKTPGEITEEEEEEEASSVEGTADSSFNEEDVIQLDETNEKTNWAGFDEDMPTHNVDDEPEQPSSSVQAHDISEAKDDYEGDGFGAMKYKLLRGKGKGEKSSVIQLTPFGNVAMAAGIFLLVSCCLCYLRYRRRKYAQSKRPNRGNYAALGRHDFFNGTFSDDLSYYEKDSDDDISIESYGSDDGGQSTNLEMGGIHEFDANGGLTLEEING